MDTEKVFGVSDFLDYINSFLVEERVMVAGEVSNCSPHPSGIYFSLKDEDGSTMDCYLSPFTYRKMGIQLENGLKIKASGWPEIYKPRGKFSFKVQGVELTGEGTLRKAYEQLKLQLQQEGVFDQKRELPNFIEKIGIITSKTGAVIDDFRKNLEPLGCKLYLADTRVEGAKAVEGIVAGMEYFNSSSLDLDVIVIIRGGGSLEELQAFNNERVARAIYASKIPTICGIGHDRDVPIATLVSDKATSTPSIAATLINASWNPLRKDVPLLATKLLHSGEVMIRTRRGQIPALVSRLARAFEELVASKRRFLVQAGTTFTNALSNMFREYRERTRDLVRVAGDAILRTKRKTEEYARYLEAVSPERTLRLGYSILFDDNGHVLKDAAKIQPGAKIRGKISAGELTATVDTVTPIKQ